MDNIRVIYLLNGKRQRQIIDKIIQRKKLSLCYKRKCEKIFRNNDILISCHKTYNNICCLSQSALDELKEIGLTNEEDDNSNSSIRNHRTF